MRACWLKWVGRDWSISADYIWLNYSGANSFGVVPIIVTLLSGPDEFAFTALAAGSAWVMAWASITSVEIVSFVQRSAPKELCGKVLAFVYMMLSCATPIGQLVYGLAYDRWAPAIVFAGMLAVLTLTTVQFYRLKSRLWQLS